MDSCLHQSDREVVQLSGEEILKIQANSNENRERPSEALQWHVHLDYTQHLTKDNAADTQNYCTF